MDETHRRRAARKELSSLVSAWAKQTGKPHALVHAELRRICGGPEVARASADQIEARISQVRSGSSAAEMVIVLNLAHLVFAKLPVKPRSCLAWATCAHSRQLGGM